LGIRNIRTTGRFRIPKRVQAQSFVSKNDGLEKADRKTARQMPAESVT
jgi:hypothetical protein